MSQEVIKQWLVKTLIVLAGVFAPAKGMLISAFCLCMTDFVTGILASRKRGEVISSKKMKQTLIKLFIYEVAILLGFVTEVYLIEKAIPVSNIIASLVGMTELTSVLENMNTISDNEVLKAVLDKLKILTNK